LVTYTEEEKNDSLITDSVHTILQQFNDQGALTGLAPVVFITVSVMNVSGGVLRLLSRISRSS